MPFAKDIEQAPDVLELQRMKRPYTVYVLTHAGTRRVVHCRLFSSDAADEECSALKARGFLAVIDY